MSGPGRLVGVDMDVGGPYPAGETKTLLRTTIPLKARSRRRAGAATLTARDPEIRPDEGVRPAPNVTT